MCGDTLDQRKQPPFFEPDMRVEPFAELAHGRANIAAAACEHRDERVQI